VVPGTKILPESFPRGMRFINRRREEHLSGTCSTLIYLHGGAEMIHAWHFPPWLSAGYPLRVIILTEEYSDKEEATCV